MRIRTGILLLLLGATTMLPAQQTAPEREFRGVWIATVKNIDYPVRPDRRRVAQQEDYKLLLDRLSEVGINAVIVQIRSVGDAFYPTELAPWSKYLTGEQGLPPEPLYDPLAFMIEETHKRGMEFHAWMNPYRATIDTVTKDLSPTHFMKQRPDLALLYGGRWYFNPARPEVREHIFQVVEEVVRNYEVDAIHFDDYFYPYPVAGQPFPDSLDFTFYGAGFRDIADWRRNNVDQLIAGLSTRIHAIKPEVQFGISPFGVWRNKVDDPQGSDTQAGAPTYDYLYADVRKWVREGWLDYVAPQIYWHVGFEPADFARLLSWWGANSYDVPLYIGQAAYKVAQNAELPWHDAREIPQQIEMIRRHPKAAGSIYFNTTSVLRGRLGLRDSLRLYYQHSALLPELDHIDSPPAATARLQRVRYKNGQVEVHFRASGIKDGPKAKYYAVYRSVGNSGGWPQRAELVGISPWLSDCDRYIFYDKTTRPGLTYTYGIYGINATHRKSPPGKLKSLTVPGVPAPVDPSPWN